MTQPVSPRIPLQSILVLDGVRWLVVGQDKDCYRVETVDGRESVALSRELLRRAVSEMRCEVITPAALVKKKALLQYTGGIENVDQLSEQMKMNVRAALALVRGIDVMEAEGEKITHRFLDQPHIRSRLQSLAFDVTNDRDLFRYAKFCGTKLGENFPKGRTLCVMRKRWKDFDQNPVVLIQRHNKKGPRGLLGRRLTAVQDRFVQYVVSQYSKPTKPQLAPLYRLARAKFDESFELLLQGMSYPSLTTVRNALKRKSKRQMLLGREGRKVAQNQSAAGVTDIRALEFGQSVFTDQVYLSIFVRRKGTRSFKEVDPKTVTPDLQEDEVLRVWLHVMIDRASRMPLAWVLSDTADGNHSIELHRMATRDKTKEKVRYGCKSDPAPATGILFHGADNGTATRNGAVYAAQLGLNMIARTGRTYVSTDQAPIESFFRTVQFQLLNFLDGYTGSRPGELAGYDAKKAASLALGDLYERLTHFFIDVYPLNAHRGADDHNATPMQRFRRVMKEYGEIDPPSPEARRIHLGIRKEVSTNNQGVQVFGLPYSCTELQEFTGGSSKKVTVHIDPDFIREVTIFAEGREDPMTGKLSMTALQDCNLDEAQDALHKAAEADPELKAEEDKRLGMALRRQAEASILEDPRCPDTYRRVERLERQAEALSKVESRPASFARMTCAPGSITALDGSANSYRPGGDTAWSSSSSVASKPDFDPKSLTFKPVKESKI